MRHDASDMSRAFLIVLDSVGIGAAADAPRYGDDGADTLGHIAEACAAAPRGPLRLPQLERLGLGLAAAASRGAPLPGCTAPAAPEGAWGFAVEHSRGKDTPSGHWEMAGLPVDFDWGYFPKGPPSFPAALTRALIEEGAIPGILGDRHASGTVIIDELGAEHLATLKPIVYTSADSVLQIAAHEEAFGLERLYQLCRTARRLADPYNIGRIIARPFIGAPGSFRRTGNRHDYAVPPHEPTLLDRLAAAGREVRGIGKIEDIFAGRGVTRSIAAPDNETGFAHLLEATGEAPEGSLTFANLNDFDTLYGHRRDVAGYAAALERFDDMLPRFIAALRPGDAAFLSADHGCDPTFRGSDHTREHVPVLAFGPAVTPRPLGRRDGFADIGQSIARHLGIAPLAHGSAFL
jgi:phosphopentomutase